MKKISFGLLTFLFSIFFLMHNAFAEIEIDAFTKVVETKQATGVDYAKITKELNTIEESINSGQAVQGAIGSYVKTLSELEVVVVDSKKQSDKNLSYVQRRIEALGDAPKEGETESDVIAKNREEFTIEAASIKAKTSSADVILAKIDELQTLILNTRNQEILDNLLEKQPLLINPSNLFVSTAKFVEFFFDIVRSPIYWYKDLTDVEKKEFKSSGVPFFIAFIIFLWIADVLRVFIKEKFGYRDGVTHPKYSAKIFAAIFVAFGYGVIPATIVGGGIFWIKSHYIMTQGFFGLVLTTALYYLLFIILGLAIVRVVLAKNHEKWRLFSIPNDKAYRLTSALYFAVIMISLVSFLDTIAQSANYSLDLIHLIRTVGNVIKAACVIVLTHRSLCCGDCVHNANEEEGGEVSFCLKATVLVAVFAIGVFGLSLFGYPNLSAYIFNKTILSVLLIAALVVLSNALEDLFEFIMSFKVWSKLLKMGKRKVNRLTVWFTVIVNPILIFAGAFMLLGLWGVSTDFLWQSSKKLLFGFSIGGIKVSLVAILTGFMVFFVTLAVFKLFRNKILNNVLDKMGIESSVRHSLSSGLGFVGLIIAALLSIVVMGGSLNNIALIAGALSLGVGLGLQGAVNNFVSGIILLFERPIKIGDWVIVNGQEGIVKQINIRATEIETWTKASVIIPNADILSTTVTNLTLQDKMGRVDIKIGVAYGSDVDEVKKILIDVAHSDDRVMKKPEPYVVFADFADSSLSFELRCYTTDVMQRNTISSDLRTKINDRFIEERVEIPFPQMVINSISQNTHFLERMSERHKVKDSGEAKVVKKTAAKKHVAKKEKVTKD